MSEEVNRYSNYFYEEDEMSKYRLKAHSLAHDIWIIEKKYLWLIWLTYGAGGAGNKARMEEVKHALEEGN